MSLCDFGNRDVAIKLLNKRVVFFFAPGGTGLRRERSPSLLALLFSFKSTCSVKQGPDDLWIVQKVVSRQHLSCQWVDAFGQCRDKPMSSEEMLFGILEAFTSKSA